VATGSERRRGAGGDGRGRTAPRAAPASPASSARACAFAVVRRVFEHGAYADRALHSEASALDPRDRALATALSYGTIQRRRTLDHVIARLSARPVSRLDPATLAALRLGVFQLLFLGGVADHAAVNETVELAKRSRREGAGLVNAVLRRAAREGRAVIDELDDGDPGEAALLHSVPDWLAMRWWDELGAADARALLARVNEPAESALRVNTLVADREGVLARLPVGSTAAPALPEGIVLGGPFDAHGSELFGRGAIMPQSRGSMLVSRVLAPEPGERVLDLCAAPGAKTTHLAALLEDRGEVVAVERHRGRAGALARTCRRMRAQSIHVEVGDAAHRRRERPYDRVLVDPPCSGLGTLQSRPDLRWRASPDAIVELAGLQRRILDAAGEVTAPGGALVYSVCTISRVEGPDVIDGYLREHPEFAAEDAAPLAGRERSERRYLQLLPHRDRTDGFFVARLRRR
jgi:16S rRNA (cytosine967-C5)-methyltransferase